MISLWLPLFCLLVVALGFVVWPLWRYKNTIGTLQNNQDDNNLRLAENVRLFRENLTELENNVALQVITASEFQQLKLDLERNLLADEAELQAQQKMSSRRSSATIVLLTNITLLLVGFFFYQHNGGLLDVYLHKLQQEKLQLDYQDMLQGREPNPTRSQPLIEGYEDLLQKKPDNSQYWFLLAREQMEVGNFAEAVKAYQRLIMLDVESPMIMAELAQALFLRDDNKITPPVVDLANNTLKLDPKNTTALGLLGIDAFSRKDYRSAITYWQKSVNVLSPDSQGRAALLSGIEKAKQSFIAEGGKPADLVTASAFTLTISASLADRANVKPEDTLFIYARAWQGSPMPLAIKRLKVSDLPTTVQLDETMAMSPAASLATATDIEVIARVSSSGSAKAETGDWFASQGPISMKALPENIHLTIDQQIK